MAQELNVSKPRAHKRIRKRNKELKAQGVYGDARWTGTGETLPAFPEKATKVYPKATCTAEDAAHIPCKQILGTYVVQFEQQMR